MVDTFKPISKQLKLQLSPEIKSALEIMVKVRDALKDMDCWHLASNVCEALWELEDGLNE